MVKTAIVGACGFLGSHVVEEALRRGHDAYLVDRLTERGHDWWHGKYSFEPHVFDLGAGDADWIINCALPVEPGRGWVTFNGILRLEQDLLTKASEIGARYVTMSSILAEEPTNMYGAAKAAAEMLCQVKGQRSVRLPTLWGPRQAPPVHTAFVPNLVYRWLRGEPMRIRGLVDKPRPYLHVGQAARWIIDRVEDNEGTMYNPRMISLSTWLDAVRDWGELDGELIDEGIVTEWHSTSEMPIKHELVALVEWMKQWIEREH